MLHQHMNIELFKSPVSSRDQAGLQNLLRDCVEGGASIGFVMPLPEAENEAYWAKICSENETGKRLVWVARDEAGQIVGAVQLALETRSNGRHRAEVQKLMVLRSHRNRGLAGNLMVALENEARGRELRLLFLDTSEGAGGACGFYRKLGYSYAGGIPEYALDPDGSPAKNAIFYKLLPVKKG